MSIGAQIVTQLTNLATAQRGAAQIRIPLQSFVLASTGGPMSVFADSTNNPSVPGPQITDSETFTIRWNNAATTTGIATNVYLPSDIDTASPLYVRCIVSKTGATVGDASTLTIGWFNTIVGTLHDSDSNAGGATNAVVGDLAAKTTSLLSRTIAAADLVASTSAAPAFAALTIKVTDGTLGTDDFLLHGVVLDYTRKLPT